MLPFWMLTKLRRVSHMIYGTLQRQQSTLDSMQRKEISMDNIPRLPFVDQGNPQSARSLVQVHLSEIAPSPKQSTPIISKPTKLVPWTVRYDRWGFSVQIVALPKDKSTKYQAVVQISLLGKVYTVQLQMSCPDFSFDRMLHVCNIVPIDSALAVACKTGDFDSAYGILTGGVAHGYDITGEGLPMIDVRTLYLMV